MNWPAVEIADIASTQYGYTASASDNQIGPKFLRITDIVPSSINWDAVPYCAIDEKNYEKYRLHARDVVVARTGATTGYAKLIRSDHEAVFASYLVRFRAEDERVDNRFLGLAMESQRYKAFVKSTMGGAAQPNANAKTLARFKLPLPPLKVQDRVVAIVSAYDDLIENNRRRIALLEEAARLLYREWFVHLRFPGHEHVEIVDGVPKGWERRTLGSVLNLQRGFDLPVAQRVSGGVPVYGSTGQVGEHDTAKISVPTLVTGRSGTLGKVCFVDDPCWPLNTSLWVTEFKTVSVYFGYFLLSAMNLARFSGGASVPTLDRKVVHAAPVIIPTQTLLSLFDEQVEVLFRQRKTLEIQNENLAQARDLLLPRLMNGEITV